jgi:hypothetical protein
VKATSDHPPAGREPPKLPLDTRDWPCLLCHHGHAPGERCAIPLANGKRCECRA